MSLHQQNPYIVSMQGSLKTNALLTGITLPPRRRKPLFSFSINPFKFNFGGFIACGDYEDVRNQEGDAPNNDVKFQKPDNHEPAGKSPQDASPGPGALQRVAGEVEESDTAPAGSAEESGIEVNGSDPEVLTAFYFKDTSYVVEFLDNKKLQDMDILPVLISEVFKQKRNECIDTITAADPINEEYHLFDSIWSALVENTSKLRDFQKLSETYEQERGVHAHDPAEPQVWYKINFSRVADDDANDYEGVHLCVFIHKPTAKTLTTTVHNFYLFKSLSKSTKKNI